MPTVTTTSTTTMLGIGKIVIGVLSILSGIAVGVFGHDWAGATTIIASGAAGAGLLSGAGLIAAQDAPEPKT